MLYTKQLTFNKEERTLTADVSTLPSGFLSLCSETDVKSSHTGKVITFRFYKQFEDDNGKVLRWEFVVSGHQRRFTSAKKMIIFNRQEK